MVRLTTLFICLIAVSIGYGQRDFSAVVIENEPIGDDFHVLFGSGGNILICIEEESVLMIDSQFGPLSEKIKAKIDELSGGLPIEYLLNTHYHGDHTGGNENFHAHGLTIMAHQNVKKRLSEDQHMAAFNRVVEAKARGFQPDISYTEKGYIYFGDHPVELIHLPFAHTDGDSGIYFPDDNLIHMGDTFFKDRFPFIDLSGGGSIDGIIEAIKYAIALIDEETVVIPGHGTVSDVEDLHRYLEMLETVRERVTEGMAEDMTIEELKAAKLTEGFESFDGGFISADKFVDFIWTDYSRK